MKKPILCIAAIILLFSRTPADAAGSPDHIQGEMAGEATPHSVILQSRLTAAVPDESGDVPGAEGFALFEVSGENTFEASKFTPWQEAVPENDYIIKSPVGGLEPDTQYWYRLVFGSSPDSTSPGPARTFRTLPAPGDDKEVSFVVVTGMHYSRFHNNYTGPDRRLGYPALETILGMEPDFFVGTGDNVYYDHMPRATTRAGIRKKWHEQFVQQRYVELFSRVPTYWEKDDHDFRFDDCDNTNRLLGINEPSAPLGRRTFLEQLPVTAPEDREAVTYRTHRIGRHLQVWLLEGRDYRSPNNMPDGPKKTLWGKRQLEWLKKTLLESDASFRIIISPTPLIGPDDKRKRDNHTNIGGFRYEGDAFLEWFAGNGLPENGGYVICGDRHWQYHSIHPSGVEEFSTGALVDGNSRMGVAPGDAEGTDPEGLISQPYTSPEPSGGFLHVKITPAGEDGATAEFYFFDEKGNLLYSVIKENR